MAEPTAPGTIDLHLNPNEACVTGVLVRLTHALTVDQYQALLSSAQSEGSTLNKLLGDVLSDAIHNFLQDVTQKRADQVRMSARLARDEARGKVTVPAQAPTAPPPTSQGEGSAQPHAPELGELFKLLAAAGTPADRIPHLAAAQTRVPLPIITVLFRKHMDSKKASEMASWPPAPAEVKKKPAKKAGRKASPKKPTPTKAKAAGKGKKSAPPPPPKKPVPKAAPRPVTRKPRPKKKV